MLRLSLFGVICVIWFLFFEIVGRFLYPFGDEPDFIARAPSLIFGDHFWVSPYYWLDGVLATLNYSPSCNIVASPFSIWAEIDPLNCSEPINQIISRIFISFIVCAPLILMVCFVQKTSESNNKTSVLNYGGQRVEALALALLVPGITYSLGVLAEEQLVLVLSLLVIVVDRRRIATALLLAAILALDFGNGVVVTALVFFLNAYRYAARFLNIRTVLLIALGQAAIALIAGIAFIGVLSNVSFLADKADAIYNAVSASDLVEKYPVYLRPAITFMTGVFMTPSFIKVVPAFLIVGALSAIVTLRLARVYSSCENERKHGAYILDGKRERIVDCFAVVATILFFIFLIPTYSNAKYYLFAVPFLFRAALLVMGKRRILVFLIFSQFFVMSALFLFRL